MLTDQAVNANAGGASVVQIESSRLLPWMMLSNILCGFAVALSAFTLYEVGQSRQQYQYDLGRTQRSLDLLKIQTEFNNAIVVRAGLVRKEDIYNGPEGNITYQPKEKPHGRP